MTVTAKNKLFIKYEHDDGDGTYSTCWVALSQIVEATLTKHPGLGETCLFFKLINDKPNTRRTIFGDENCFHAVSVLNEFTAQPREVLGRLEIVSDS